jgi:site-specific recombinase XerD
VSAYGRWLGHLTEVEPSALTEHAAERITEARLARYLAHLAETAGSMGQHMYFQKLRASVRVMFPGSVPEHLTALVAHLASERRPRSKAERIVATPRLIKFGNKLMKQALGPDGSVADPLGYRNGLMLGLLACRPMRRRTYTLIGHTTHLRQVGTDWYMVFEHPEVKSKRPVRTTVPRSLVPRLETYLREVRPQIPGADRHNALWAGVSGPLTADGISNIISSLTRAEFGRPISPHLFRHCAATYIAMVAPGRIGVARDLLDHTTDSTTNLYYNMAGSLHAGDIYAEILAEELAAARRRLRLRRTRASAPAMNAGLTAGD